MFFLPLRLHFANSSLPKIASFASDVVRFLKLATSDPGLFCITYSTGVSFGGVGNGGGGIFVNFTVSLLLAPPVLLPPPRAAR